KQYNIANPDKPIPEGSKFIRQIKETDEIEYEAAPPPLDYPSLEKKFLTESDWYRQSTMRMALATVWPWADWETFITRWKERAFEKLSNADQKKVLEHYAQLVLTPEGKPAKFKVPPQLLPVAKVISITGWGERMVGVRPFRSTEELSKTVLEASKLVIPGVWTLDIMDMEPWQIAVNAAIDVAFIGLVFGPPVVRALRPSLRVTKAAARTAGTAQVKMVRALKELRTTSVTSPRYAKVASTAQKAIYTSMRADRAFIDRLAVLKNVRTGELAKGRI
ncbi:unnamed protein product, partial [marine sediment metagenome]